MLLPGLFLSCKLSPLYAKVLVELNTAPQAVSNSARGLESLGRSIESGDVSNVKPVFTPEGPSCFRPFCAYGCSSTVWREVVSPGVDSWESKWSGTLCRHAEAWHAWNWRMMMLPLVPRRLSLGGWPNGLLGQHLVPDGQVPPAFYRSKEEGEAAKTKPERDEGHTRC